MRAVSLAVAGVLLSAVGALAQTGTPTIPVPPTASAEPVPNGVPVSTPVPAAEVAPPVLPGGTPVSKPLQPADTPPPAEPTPPAPKAEAAPAKCEPPHGPLGGSWGGEELLLWWPKAHPLPPLVTASRLGGPPVLGRPDTVTLVGSHAIDNQDIAGGRFTQGFSLNAADTVGIEGIYFFLGTRTLGESVTDLGNLRYRSICLPFVNALTGQEDVVHVARPGVSSALVTVTTTTRVQGAELNAVGNLVATDGVKINALAGYRFLQVHEGLRVEQRWLTYPTGPDALRNLGMVADQFDGHNRFSGGQLGLSADLRRGVLFMELVGKVALGRSFEVVRIDGATNLITTGTNPLPLLRSYPGGVYAQPTNMGRVTYSAFAVVPEAQYKVGLRFGDWGRFYVGYNFLYLSDAARPGDQIDRTINPTQVQLLNPNGVLAGIDRPRPAVVRSDFWVQGLVI